MRGKREGKKEESDREGRGDREGKEIKANIRRKR